MRVPNLEWIVLSIVREKCLMRVLNAAGGIQVIRNVAERVQTLHKAGLVHRDLKPANILWLPRKNCWTIIDFATVASIGTDMPPAYTLPYAAPEALEARSDGFKVHAGAALDAWSVGVIAFELLTGNSPFPDGASAEKV